MSKRCPDCHRINDDSRAFCSYCGAALDAQVRLIQDLEKQKNKESPTIKEKKDVNFSISRDPTPQKEKKSSPVPWIVLGLLVVAVILWFIFK